MYIFEGNNVASVILDESILTDEQKSKGMHWTELPKEEFIGEKTSVLKCDIKNNKLWYEYYDLLDTST